ncbi:TSUP family transporter [Azospirillum endophyticum]
MTPGIFALIALAVLLAAFVQGMTGVGFALITVPVVALLEPSLLPVLVLLLMMPLNAYMLWRERAALDWRGMSWVTIGRLLGTAGGLAVLLVLVPWQLDLLVGLAMVAAAVTTLLAPAFRLRPAVCVGAGVITGITETATGIGGPPLALLYQHQSAAVLRATVSACFLAGQILSLAALAAAGRIGMAQIDAALLFLPVLAAGALLSHLVHHRAGGVWMRRFLNGFALLSGAILILRGLG